MGPTLLLPALTQASLGKPIHVGVVVPFPISLRVGSLSVEPPARCKAECHASYRSTKRENLSTTPLGRAVPMPDCDQSKSRLLCHDRALPCHKIVTRVPHASQKPRRGSGPGCSRAQAGAIHQAGAGLGQVQPLLGHRGCLLLYLSGINFISLATPI